MASVLNLSAVSKSFGGLTAVSDVSLTVEAGERRAIIGPNGAGKTTLFSLISGEQLPTSGRIELFGQTAILADNRSRLVEQAGPIIYFDNVLTVGGGVSIQPFASIGLTLSAELGAAYDLFDRLRDPWRFESLRHSS